MPPAADSEMIGKIGRVTGRIAPGETGEVMIAVRGGTSAFHAHPADGVTTTAGRCGSCLGTGAGRRPVPLSRVVIGGREHHLT